MAIERMERRRSWTAVPSGAARLPVFFNRLGEIRDRSFENQRHRVSGLNLVVAAITLWNTVYPERGTEQMAKSQQFDPALLQHVSPLGWHVNLTGATLGTLINGWPMVATVLSETLEMPPRVLSVHKFPFLEVAPVSL